MRISPTYYRYDLPQAKNINFDYWMVMAMRLDFMRKEGHTWKQISEITGLSDFKLYEKFNKYMRRVYPRPYKENRDVYAEFKAHYDDVMGVK